MSRFSFYKAPVRNVVPACTADLREIHRLITGDAYRPATEELRRLCSRMQQGTLTRRDIQAYKATHFDYVTFSGTFSRRHAQALQSHSGLLTLDFDHVETWHGQDRLRGVYGLRYALLRDAAVTTALLFRSPSGDGLKWVVPIDLAQGTHENWFRVLSYYTEITYGIVPDSSGSDVARACYLPWDPDAVLV